jgi:hypothetical protein
MRILSVIVASLAVAPVGAAATEFIFQTVGVHDPKSLQAAHELENSCADLRVRFRLHVLPSDDTGALQRAMNQMERAGYSYYITAASADYGSQHLYWEPGVMCRSMRERPHLRGLYFHELISEKVGGMRQGFADQDWSTIRQYADCAKSTGRKIIWSEWAGGDWGWHTFLAGTSEPHSLAHRTLSGDRDVFVFLWANNRNVRAPDQFADMELARMEVRDLGNPFNPTTPQGLTNPIRYAFPHGISIQDWYWFETHRDSRGYVDPKVMAALPPSIVTDFGVPEFAAGGRYFQFEGYWSNHPDNSSGVYNPGFFAGITNLRNQIVTAAHCATSPAR